MRNNFKFSKTKWLPNITFAITHAIFELHTPDFAWKFVSTVSTNYGENTWNTCDLFH